MGSGIIFIQMKTNGTGIHWTELDEDLSLKGFLRDAVKDQITGNKVA